MEKERTKFHLTLICDNSVMSLCILYGSFSFPSCKPSVESIWGEKTGSVSHHFVSERQSWGEMLGRQTSDPISIRWYFVLPTSQKITGEATLPLLLQHVQKALEKWHYWLIVWRREETKTETLLVSIGRKGCIFFPLWKEAVWELSLSFSLSPSLSSSLHLPCLSPSHSPSLFPLTSDTFHT